SGDADVFSRRSAARPRSDLSEHSRRTRSLPPHLIVRLGYDGSGSGARLSLRHRVARPERHPDAAMTASDDVDMFPTASQTAGPFFDIGFSHLCGDHVIPATAPDRGVVVRGRVLDGNAEPI